MVLSLIISFILFFIAVSIHEFAHAFAADKLGDPTPRIDGRLTLDPRAHIDPFGTLLLPLSLILIGSPLVFGWAKPVIFDPYNLKNKRRDTALIAVAGPVSNIIMAVSFSILIRLIGPGIVVEAFLAPFIILNLTLALFNLLPIHPLDGGKILVGLLPYRESHQFDLFLTRYGMYILIAMMLPIWNGSSPIFSIINPILEFIAPLFLPHFLTTL